MFLRFLEAVPLVSTSRDRGVEQAIAFLLKHRRPRLRVGCEETGDAGQTVRPLLDLSFVSEAWWPLVTGRKAHDPAPVTVDRRIFELCLFPR
jgi:hypothetical protein